MNITSIQLKNFRCFKNQTFSFELKPIIILIGVNGSGKTSLLEALYYACYLRSFRSNNIQDMIQLDAPSCFIKVTTTDDEGEHTIQIGFSAQERAIKIDGKTVKSYKDLISRYKIVIVMEDDIMLIQGAPELRRTFIDHAVLMQDPAQAGIFRTYKQVLKQRNALLAQNKSISHEEYTLWTEKLWILTHQIQTLRNEYLKKIETHVNRLAQQVQDTPITISLIYKSKIHDIQSYKQWIDLYMHKEQSIQRSLFGAHLDDFEILFHNKASRQFASRGQQKLIAVLIKIAQCELVNNNAIILLDDFMTDFDSKNAQAIIDLLRKRNVQTVFTAPIIKSSLIDCIEKYEYQMIDVNTA